MQLHASWFYAFPRGMQRGTTLDLSLTATNLAEPTGLWTSIPAAKVTIPSDGNNGKDILYGGDGTDVLDGGNSPGTEVQDGPNAPAGAP